MSPETIIVPVGDLRPSPSNPPSRSTVSPDFVESVRRHGILQPLLIRAAPQTWVVQEGRLGDRGGWFLIDTRKVKGHDYGQAIGDDFYYAEADAREELGRRQVPFEVIFGHRRLAAAKSAGLRTVPARLVEMTDAKAGELQLVENDQRDDLRPSEQAAAYATQVRDHGYTLEELASAVSRSVAAVRGVLALNRVPAALLAAVDEGLVSRSAAEVVARIPEVESRELAAKCVLTGATSPAVANRAGRTPLPVLTARETKDLVATHFQRELKGAPFSPRSKTLLPAAGSCTDCPKRSGNAKREDPEAFAGTRDDVCLDPACFRAKCDAQQAADRKREKAKPETTTPALEQWKAEAKALEPAADSDGEPVPDHVVSPPGKPITLRVLSVSCVEAAGLEVEAFDDWTEERRRVAVLQAVGPLLRLSVEVMGGETTNQTEAQ